jgi:hypothetical protein
MHMAALHVLNVQTKHQPNLAPEAPPQQQEQYPGPEHSYNIIPRPPCKVGAAAATTHTSQTLNSTDSPRHPVPDCLTMTPMQACAYVCTRSKSCRAQKLRLQVRMQASTPGCADASSSFHSRLCQVKVAQLTVPFAAQAYAPGSAGTCAQSRGLREESAVQHTHTHTHTHNTLSACLSASIQACRSKNA